MKKNHSEQQKGLVASRKEQILQTGFQPGYKPCSMSPTLCDEAKDQPLKSSSPTKENRNRPSSLTHLTLSRATLPSRRLPSKKHVHLGGSAVLQNELKNENISQDFKHLLKSAITTARKKYKNHYNFGKDARYASGWFSNIRHKADGQERATYFCTNITENTSATLIIELHLFFNDPKTKFNHHSFASYLLDELNALLKEYKTPEIKPTSGEYYDINTWLKMKTVFENLVCEEDLSETKTAQIF